MIRRVIYYNRSGVVTKAMFKSIRQKKFSDII